MSSRYRLTHGFTLVELSIVIIIIGFLIAGIAAGQSLIKQAALSRVIDELSNLHTAIAIFKSKYSGLPGDIPNASAYWPNCDTTPANCNGNNNNKIDPGSESLRIWQQLAAAGLIIGNYTGSGVSQFGVNMPVSGFSSSAGYISYYFGVPLDNFCIGKSPSGGDCAEQTINLGASVDVANLSPVMTTADLYNIDSKIDDGLARQGNIWGYGQPGTNNCYNGVTQPTATYNIALTGNKCSVHFLINDIVDF